MSPNILEETQVDTEAEHLDATMTAAEELEAVQRFAPQGEAGDLSNGGSFGGVRVAPQPADGRSINFRDRTPQKGRPSARRAWMWNGTESLLPLSWNPEGTQHDGGRRYLLKRFCLCCKQGGFRGVQCPNCAKTSCSRCASSTSRKMVIPLFYLKKESVPFPERFYGAIPCFLPLCVRTGDRGFRTEEEMRMHASSRHRKEYEAHRETLAARRTDDIEKLREELRQVRLQQFQPSPVAAPVATLAQPLPTPAAVLVQSPAGVALGVPSKRRVAGRGRQWTKGQREEASRKAKERLKNEAALAKA